MSLPIKTVAPKCGKEMFNRLRYNNCSFLSLVSEFIDNVAAELINCKKASITITVGGYWKVEGTTKSLDLQTAWLEVKDDATGIALENLEECISLAPSVKTEKSNSLHEHQMGMKTAIASLGTLDYLSTKTKNCDVAYKINSIMPDEVHEIYIDRDFDRESGLTIKIKNLESKVFKRKEDYSKNLISQLGARYSRLLKGTLDGKQLKIFVNLVDENNNLIVDNAGVSASWEIQPVDPYYQDNKALVNKEIKGNNWCAKLEFGFSPSKAELEQYNIKLPTSHPYHNWTRCVQVMMHDRIICQKTADELGASKSLGRAVFLPYVGILTLLYGFQTSFTKDGVLNDENWQELTERIDGIITPILTDRAHKENQPVEDENHYKQKLYNILKNGHDKDVEQEHVCEGADGKIDLLVDKEVLELKNVQACGQDVYQCLYYIDMGKDVLKDRGKLIAPSFSPGCKYTAKLLKELRGVDVKLKTFDEMGLS